MACKCRLPGGCPWHGVVTDKESYAACADKGIDPAGAEACVYLRQNTHETKRGVDQPIYECSLLGRCTLERNRSDLQACSNCKHKWTKHASLPHANWLDPLRVTDRTGKQDITCLRNFLNGGAAFLVCGGPSVKLIDKELLRQRGVFSLGVNNVVGHVPCSAFICSDPPSKFHSGIFFDPKIMKFLPTPKLKKSRGKLRIKKNDTEFVESQFITADCPNVWGFERRSWLSCDHTWFTENSAAWGNHNEGVERTGEEKTVNTMFLGLRMLQYLGAKKIFLLGVDFFMDPAVGLNDNYCFGEKRDDGAIRSNNRQYGIAADWLTRLRPVFEKFGFKTYNCNQHSSLRAFDYVPFDVAVDVCRGKVPREPFDLNGWYEK